MKKIIIFFLVITLTGCAAQHIPIPKPAPMPSCDMKVNSECREMTAGERSGAVVRGHGEETKDIKP